MRRYVRWYREGYMSHNGRCFDVGRTTRRALEHFEASGNPYSGPTDEKSAGNGCLARLAPVVLFFHPDEPAAMRFAEDSTRTTHGAQECIAAAGVFATILHRALAGVPMTPEEIRKLLEAMAGAKTVDVAGQDDERGDRDRDGF